MRIFSRGPGVKSRVTLTEVTWTRSGCSCVFFRVFSFLCFIFLQLRGLLGFLVSRNQNSQHRNSCPFLDYHVKIKIKIWDRREDFSFPNEDFPFLDGDVSFGFFMRCIYFSTCPFCSLRALKLYRTFNSPILLVYIFSNILDLNTFTRD